MLWTGLVEAKGKGVQVERSGQLGQMMLGCRSTEGRCPVVLAVDKGSRIFVLFLQREDGQRPSEVG